jgi:hypothetical protein
MTEKQKNRKTERQNDRKTERQKDRKIERQMAGREKMLLNLHQALSLSLYVTSLQDIIELLSSVAITLS